MGARPAAWPAFERTTATTRAEGFPRKSRHRLENQHGQHVSLSQEVFVRLDRKRMQSRLLASPSPSSIILKLTAHARGRVDNAMRGRRISPIVASSAFVETGQFNERLVAGFHQICYFQHVLKTRFSVDETELRATKLLESLLHEVPVLKLKQLNVESEGRDAGIDIIMRVDISGEPHFLVCEVKQNGQPRYVRDGIHQLQNYVAHFKKPATPVLVAPYFSPVSRELCRDNGISYLDFEGNAHLAFKTVFIDRLTEGKPASERREFKSLFTPKSSQVLRVLLRDPKRIWRVADLAEAAHVSLGHVSNVRTALLDREWAEVVSGGLHLIFPDALLDAWKSSYEPPVEQQFRFYTTLHGKAFDASIRDVFESMPQMVQTALASFSAANWIAPYARTTTQFFYAEKRGLDHIQSRMKLSSTAKGENVIITIPKDPGVFMDAYEPAPGVRCTSPIQTYLDLSKGGERGEEAAEHLRRMKLTWQK